MEVERWQSIPSEAVRAGGTASRVRGPGVPSRVFHLRASCLNPSGRSPLPGLAFLPLQEHGVVLTLTAGRGVVPSLWEVCIGFLAKLRAEVLL